MFKTGKKGYVKVDIYRKRLDFAPSMLKSVVKGLTDALSLFCKKYIQNNLAENSNSTLQSLFSLKGNHTSRKLERRIRGLFCIRNNGYNIPARNLGRKHRTKVLFGRVFMGDYHGEISELEVNIMKEVKN